MKQLCRAVSVLLLSFLTYSVAFGVSESSANTSEREGPDGNDHGQERRDSVDGGQRDWTVADSVAIRYVVERPIVLGPLGAERVGRRGPIVSSPDGRWFFFLTYRGDLARDCPLYELLVYSYHTVAQSVARSRIANDEYLSPFRRVSTCGYDYKSQNPAIVDAQWSEDSTSIVYTAVEGEGPRRINRLNVLSGTIDSLSDDHHDVFQYTVRGQGVVYSVGLKNSIFDTPAAYPTVVSTPTTLQQAAGDSLPSKFLLYTTYKRGPAHLVGSALDWQAPFIGRKNTWISPDGTQAITLRSTRDFPIPRHWSNYDGLGNSCDLDKRSTQDCELKLRRFLLIDLVRGTSRPIFDAPGGWATRSGGALTKRLGYPDVPELPLDVLWSPDGTRAIVVNTALPQSVDAPEREHTSYLIDFEVATGRWQALEPMVYDEAVQGVPRRRIAGVKWAVPGHDLLVSYEASGGTRPTTYRRVNDRWIARRVSSVERAVDTKRNDSREVQIESREGANAPPVVVAAKRSQVIPLLPPDPALHGVYRAIVQEVSWTEQNGKTIRGGLLLPRHVPPDKRPPLVIQAYSWLPDEFRPDGVASTAYAAQPLIARGMAVLFMDIPNTRNGRSLVHGDQLQYADEVPLVEEGDFFVKRIDSAVEFLAGRGLIDASRVGLIGFSRGGYFTYYAITHPGRTHLGAAVGADGWTGGFDSYMLAAARGGDGFVENEHQNGGSFWQNKQAWLDRAPDFNVDRVSTPTLFMYNGAAAPFLTTGIVGAFSATHRTFEMVFFPRSEHQLQRPREREASLQASVDWMAFWLQGEESPSASAAERMARWRKLRDQREAGSQGAEASVP